MKFRYFFYLILLVISGHTASAAQAPFTNYPQQIILRTENKKYICPAQVRMRSIPEGRLFRTDFMVDADLRSIYIDLSKLLTGVKKNESGESIRLYNVMHQFAGNQIVITSTADYKRDIVGDLQLEQTVQSEVAFTPGYADGALRLDYKIIDARLEGIAGQLGLNANAVVQLIFDLLLGNKLEYRLFPETDPVPVHWTVLTFTSKDNQFYGVKAEGRAWLSDQQLGHLCNMLR